MRNIAILGILVFALIIGVPGYILAASGSVSSNSDLHTGANGIGDSFQMSNNVTITYNIGPDGDAEHYALISSHNKGNNLYGAASGDSAVYVNRNAKNEGDDYTTAPTTTGSDSFSGWDTL